MWQWCTCSSQAVPLAQGEVLDWCLGGALRGGGGGPGGSVGGGGPGGAIWGGGGGEAPLTFTCPPSNHSITINLTLTFAASWFGHARHVDWAEQDTQISFMAALATSFLSIVHPHTNSD